MDAKHKIKVQILKKGMDLTQVWKDLEEYYWKDLKVYLIIIIHATNFEFWILFFLFCVRGIQESRPQDKGKAKVREMIEKFKKKCMEKVTRKSLDPAEFKQGT